MKQQTCYNCGFTDNVYHSVCPSCQRNYNTPQVAMTNGLLVQHISDRKGRGVITTKKIEIGELIESCPVIVIPKDQVVEMTENVLWNYMFPWKVYDSILGDRAIAMGFGMLYNHHHDPNALYRFNDNKTMPSIDFYAQRNIEIGEEITISYGSNLWFHYNKNE